VEEAEKTIKLMARWNGVEMPPLSLKPVSLADKTASVSEVLATPARRKKFGLLGRPRAHVFDSMLAHFSSSCSLVLHDFRASMPPSLPVLPTPHPITADDVPPGVAWCGMGFCFYGTSFMLTRVYATTDDDETCSFDYGFLFAIYTSEFWGILYHLYQVR
jgi:hypothetical protein